MGARRYWIVFAAETVAALTILARGIPLYRDFLLTEDWDGGDIQNVSVAWVCVLVIQTAHWLSLRDFRTVRVPRVVLVGQIILFLGRLNFGFVGGVFAAIFYVRYRDLELDTIRVVSVVVMMFTMFCYSLDLERLGRLFMDKYLAAQTDSESGF